MDIKDPIVSQVVDIFIKRHKDGLKKYGTTLEENNNDCFLTHLQEELMDAVNYIQKLKTQKRSDFEIIQGFIDWHNKMYGKLCGVISIADLNDYLKTKKNDII